MSLVVDLIGQRCQDVIGRLSVSRDVIIIGCQDCKDPFISLSHSFRHYHISGLTYYFK